MKNRIKKPALIYDTYKYLPDGLYKNKGYTLVFTFSRIWCVPNFFANLNQMKINLNNCHLLIIDNTYFSELEKVLLAKADILSKVFKSVRVLKTYEAFGGCLIPKTRQCVPGAACIHIYNMHMEMLKHIHTRRFVLIEDDTLPPQRAILRLMNSLKRNKNAGIVTAIEPTQCTSPYAKTRLGVHYVKRDGWRLTERLSLKMQRNGLKKVDACGWYCFASYKDVWAKGFEGMKKYLNIIPHFALDTIHTNNIKEAGYDILADFSLRCKHMTNAGKSIYFSETKQSTPMLDIYLPDYDMYAAGLLVDWDKILKKRWNLC